MKILLIQPNYVQGSNFFDKLRMKIVFNPHITLNQLATITPENHSVDLLDETFQQINYNEDYDLVGITCCTPSAPRAYKIADEYRQNRVKVILGGYHPSALPKEAKQHADSVVIGEAENSWPMLLEDLEKNRLQPFYHSTKPTDLNHLPPLKRNIGVSIFSTARIEATRGCSFNCEFCSLASRKIGWNVFRKRPIENVIKEIQSIPQKTLIFCDSSLTIDIGYTKELFREMKYLNKKFICYGNAHVLNRDDELLELAKEAGCYIWNIGFESISQEALNSVGKKVNKAEEYQSVVKKIHDHGMAVLGQFILGFDSDTLDVFDKTIRTIEEMGVNVPSINILTPYPGTPLFDRLNKEGRILTRDWTKYTLLDVVFKPLNMSPDNLLSGFRRVVKHFYNITNCIKRDLRSINLGFSPSIGVITENIYERGCYKGVY